MSIITSVLLFFGSAAVAGAATISIVPTDFCAVAVEDAVSFDILFTADSDGGTFE